MPVQITLPDIITGENFEINRSDLMDLLLINMESLVLESQSIPALYSEMAKMQRCAKKAADEAATVYRQWKQNQSKHFKALPTHEKKPTQAAVEEHYRTLPDYNTVANAESYFLNLSYLSGDFKDAFKLKADLVRSNQSFIQGFERVEKLTAADTSLYKDSGFSGGEMDEDEAKLAAMAAEENARLAAQDNPEVPDPPDTKTTTKKTKTTRSTRKPAQGKKKASTKKGKGK